MKSTLHDLVLRQGGVIDDECGRPYSYCYDTDNEDNKVLVYCGKSMTSCHAFAVSST